MHYTQCNNKPRTYEALKVHDIQLIFSKRPEWDKVSSKGLFGKYRAVDCVLLELQGWEDLFLA